MWDNVGYAFPILQQTVPMACGFAQAWLKPPELKLPFNS